MGFLSKIILLLQDYVLKPKEPKHLDASNNRASDASNLSTSSAGLDDSVQSTSATNIRYNSPVKKETSDRLKTMTAMQKVM